MADPLGGAAPVQSKGPLTAAIIAVACVIVAGMYFFSRPSTPTPNVNTASTPTATASADASAAPQSSAAPSSKPVASNAPAAPTQMMIQLPPGTKIIVPGGTEDGDDADTQPAGDKPKGNGRDKGNNKGNGGGGNTPRNNSQPCPINAPCPIFACATCTGGTVNAGYQTAPPQFQPPPAQPAPANIDSLPDNTPMTVGMFKKERTDLRRGVNEVYDLAKAAHARLDVIEPIAPSKAATCAALASEGGATLKTRNSIGCPAQ